LDISIIFEAMKSQLKKFLLSIIFFLAISNAAIPQLPDTLQQRFDSTRLADSIALIENRWGTTDNLLKQHKYINADSPPLSFGIKEKTKRGKEFLFYLLGFVVLLIAVFKAFYSQYFNNIFRVFFNTSLRQNQLTDLLLQAKLPSLIFNTFFVISAGLYTWLIFRYYKLLKEPDNYLYLLTAVLCIAGIYFGKYIALKIMGWISGMMTAADQYIFVIFLINKIIGIILIPFIILLAFAPAVWLTPVILISIILLGILFLLRYLRSYGLLQNQIKINAFHFLLYIIGMEVVPILLIYKVVRAYLL